MNEVATFYQCAKCLRQHDGSGVVLPFRPGAPEPLVCGLGDCQDIQDRLAQEELARKERRLQGRRDRREAKGECRSAAGAPLPPSKTATGASPLPQRGRMPYRDNDEDSGFVSGSATGAAPLRDDDSGFGSAVVVGGDATGASLLPSKTPTGASPLRPLGENVGAVIERSMSQEAFEASGVADSANQRLIQFFSEPQNFNKWFPRTLLKEIAKNDYINNRADDIREYFQSGGLYIDNCNISHGELEPKTSHYRLCRIEDALSLSNEQKQKLTQSLPT